MVAATLSGYVSGVGFWDTLILEDHSPAQFSSTLGRIPLLHPEDLDELLQVCLIRVGAKLCRDPGPPGSLLFIEMCWISGFISFLADLTRFPAHSLGVMGVGMKPRPLPTELLLQSPVLWGRALWTSQRGIRDKHNVLVSVKNISGSYFNQK